jgi:hypothetical protein
LRVQKFPCGVIEDPEDHVWCNLLSGPSITPHGNFWTLNYTTWELLDPQLHHIGTSGSSITPHENFWTLNYTRHDLLDMYLRVQKFPCGLIEGSKVHMWYNCGFRNSYVV